MGIFKSRYFFIACLISIAISITSFFVLPFVKLILIGVTLCVIIVSAVLYLLKKVNNRIFIVSIIFSVAILASSSSSYIAFDVKYMSEKAIVGNEVEIEAIVLAEEYSSGNLSGYSIRVESVNGQRKNYQAIYKCMYTSEVKPGDRIKATVLACDFVGNVNGYLEKQQRLASGYYLYFESLSENDYEIIESNVFDFQVFFNKLNFNLSYKLRDAIQGEHGNIASALLLGNREYLSETTVRDFRRAGVSHILALSGMHMVIVMGALSFLLKLVRTPKIVRVLFLICASCFYLSLTGFSMSTTRSVIMLLWVYAGLLLSYKSDSLTNLSFAGAIILAVSPFAILDIGFWMSFSATFGIVVFMPAFMEMFTKVQCENLLVRLFKKLAVAIIGTFVTTIFAFLGLIIVICIFTKEIALYTILTAAITTLPASCIILFSLLLPLFSCCQPIRSIIITVIRSCASFTLNVCSDISFRENVMFSIDYDFLTYFAIAFGIVFLFSLSIKLKHKHLVFLMYIPVILSFIITVAIVNLNDANNVHITYLNTSSRSDIIVLTNSDDAIICDLSNGSKNAFYYALDVIDNSRISEIEAIMLSDYHTAHIPTLSEIFKSRIVREIWLPEPTDEDSYYRLLAIVEIAKENNVTAKMYTLGKSLLAFGGVDINLVQDYIKRSTVPISALKIECGNDTFTYISPAFVECESRELFDIIIYDSEYVILGTRGPNIKEDFALYTSNLKELLIPDENMIIFLDSSEISNDLPIW